MYKTQEHRHNWNTGETEMWANDDYPTYARANEAFIGAVHANLRGGLRVSEWMEDPNALDGDRYVQFSNGNVVELALVPSTLRF